MSYPLWMNYRDFSSEDKKWTLERESLWRRIYDAFCDQIMTIIFSIGLIIVAIAAVMHV